VDLFQAVSVFGQSDQKEKQPSAGRLFLLFTILTGFEPNAMPLVNYISLKFNDPDYVVEKIDEI